MKKTILIIAFCQLLHFAHSQNKDSIRVINNYTKILKIFRITMVRSVFLVSPIRDSIPPWRLSPIIRQLWR